MARPGTAREREGAVAEPGTRDDYKDQQREIKKQRKHHQKARKLDQRIKGSRVRKPRSATGDEAYEQIVELVSKVLVPVDEPVALISQAPRSGGTLLRHLFDGHPECHVHPYEWHFGETKTRWPRLRLTESPEAWWVKLREEALSDRFALGIKRDPTKYRGADSPRQPQAPYAMTLPPLLHRTLFLRLAKLQAEHTERSILNAYLTALFNAWLNNHSLDDADKQWVVAFAPRLAWGDGLEGFFRAYPDGVLISVLRDPYSWFNSSAGRQPKKNDVRLITLWEEGTREMLRAKQLHPDRVTVISFDDLLQDTGGVMSLLAGRLGIAYSELMTRPTFNSRPIGANSSHMVGAMSGVSSDPLVRWKDLLSEEEKRTIRASCTELHEAALEIVERP